MEFLYKVGRVFFIAPLLGNNVLQAQYAAYAVIYQSVQSACDSMQERVDLIRKASEPAPSSQIPPAPPLPGTNTRPIRQGGAPVPPAAPPLPPVSNLPSPILPSPVGGSMRKPPSAGQLGSFKDHAARVEAELQSIFCMPPAAINDILNRLQSDSRLLQKSQESGMGENLEAQRLISRIKGERAKVMLLDKIQQAQQKGAPAPLEALQLWKELNSRLEKSAWVPLAYQDSVQALQNAARAAEEASSPKPGLLGRIFSSGVPENRTFTAWSQKVNSELNELKPTSREELESAAKQIERHMGTVAGYYNNQQSLAPEQQKILTELANKLNKLGSLLRLLSLIPIFNTPAWHGTPTAQALSSYVAARKEDLRPYWPTSYGEIDTVLDDLSSIASID